MILRSCFHFALFGPFIGGLFVSFYFLYEALKTSENSYNFLDGSIFVYIIKFSYITGFVPAMLALIELKSFKYSCALISGFVGTVVSILCFYFIFPELLNNFGSFVIGAIGCFSAVICSLTYKVSTKLITAVSYKIVIGFPILILVLYLLLTRINDVRNTVLSSSGPEWKHGAGFYTAVIELEKDGPIYNVNCKVHIGSKDYYRLIPLGKVSSREEARSRWGKVEWTEKSLIIGADELSQVTVERSTIEKHR